MDLQEYRTFMEIDLKKLNNNFLQIRNIIPRHCKIMFVVKNDAYGHGSANLLSISDKWVDWYAVATFEEGLTLREAGTKKPILIFGPVPGSRLETAADANLAMSIYSMEQADYLERFFGSIGKHFSCHIKIDTGLHRTGISCNNDGIDKACTDIEHILRLPHVQVKGIYTHFACGESTNQADIDFTFMQFNTFKSLCDCLIQKGYDLGLKHCCSSGAAVIHPEFYIDMVRMGMLPLGQSFSDHSLKELNLHIVAKWKSHVIQIKQISAGESVGYDRVFTADAPIKIAIISVGYADGYRLAFSNKAQVLVNGQRASIVGKISMDFSAIDITTVEGVEVGTEVMLLGEDGDDAITTNYLAELSDSVCGDITGSISNRVKRIYLNADNCVE